MTEMVIDGELHHAEGLMLIPYTKKELTTMLMQARYVDQYVKTAATRYRIARSLKYGVAHTAEKKGESKLCVHYGTDADELCDSVLLEQVGDGH